MGDVLTYLIDGTSGLAPGGVEGKVLVCGVCSKGEVGKAYLIGRRTNLNDMLGVGLLVDRLRSMLTTGGQQPLIVAVPCVGQQAGYITEPAAKNTKIRPKAYGVPAKNVDIVIKAQNIPARGTPPPYASEAGDGGAVIEPDPSDESENPAEISLPGLCYSIDGGKTFSEPTPYGGQLVIGTGYEATGVTLVFPELEAGVELETDAEWKLMARCAIGEVARIGDEAAPDIDVSPGPGGVLAAAEVVIKITKGGGRNSGCYQLSVDGGDNFERQRTIPYDGRVSIPDYGLILNFPAGEYPVGTVYECNALAPSPSIVDVMEALEPPLALYDVEFVYVAGPTDSVDWAAMQSKAEDLWNLQRPTYFKAECRLPHDDEDLNDYAAYLLAERQGIAARFVTVCAQFGEIVDSSGKRHIRNAGGLNAGRVISIPVQRATGRVKDGNVSQLTLPFGWEAVQATLEEAGFITAKKYAGLEGVYWGDSRTLADDTSDYRYEEVLRTVFQAVRKMRIAALKSMYDEVGDPTRANNAPGLAYLKASIENALDSMVKAIPSELADHVVEIVPGQDIANNGVAVDVALIGIPIIREIKLYPRYVYAGGTFDPRLEEK